MLVFSFSGLLWLGHTSRLQECVVHFQNDPLPFPPTTHGNTMSGAVFGAFIHAVVVGIPERVSEAADVVWRHFKMQILGVLKIVLVQILHDLFAAAEFSVLCIQHNFGIEAVFQFAGPSLVEATL